MGEIWKGGKETRGEGEERRGVVSGGRVKKGGKEGEEEERGRGNRKVPKEVTP